MNEKKMNLLVAVIFGLMFSFGVANGRGGGFLDMDAAIGDFKSGYSDVNGIKMYYEIRGTGEPLVLIHGGVSTIETSFGRLLPLVSKHFKIIAMDLQAHGRTEDRNAPESFEQDADDVAALLQNLKVSKAHVLGFSNGGNTAMQLAYRHPQLVDRLVVASSFYKREGLPPGLLDNIRNARFDVMPQVFKDAFLKVNPDPKKLRTMFEKDRDRMATFKDWNDEVLRSIKAPTLLVSGDQDVALPAHTIAMSRLIPNCRLLILPAGHGQYIGVAESPAPTGSMLEMTADVIKFFLKE
jgi:pimeloyl-ACP methyl ester carboxylesterase